MTRTPRTVLTAVGLSLVVSIPATSAAAAATTATAASAAVTANAVAVAVAAAPVQAASYRQLRAGQRGDDVRAWQATLNRGVEAGFVDHPRLAEDGSFGPRTRQATIALQAHLGVDRDGIVGRITRDGIAGLLDARPVATPRPGDRQLRAGQRGEDVRAWQVVLNRLVREGLLDRPLLAEDGSFGPRTTAATRAVQAHLGVDRDGIVGPITRDGVAGLLDG